MRQSFPGPFSPGRTRAGRARRTELLPQGSFGEMHHVRQPERGQRLIRCRQRLPASIHAPWERANYKNLDRRKETDS